MTDFVPMTTILQPGKHGSARLDHFTVSEADSAFTRMRAAFNNRPRDVVPAGDYVKLSIGGQLYMSDTPTEQHENRALIRRARGDVLIAGLGIGMVLPPLLANPDVTSVTVVEVNADVITLVAPFFPDPKLTVVEGDIFDWDPGDGQWDTIYFDIWANLCNDNEDEIADLFGLYRRALRPSGWMGAWGLPE